MKIVTGLFLGASVALLYSLATENASLSATSGVIAWLAALAGAYGLGWNMAQDKGAMQRFAAAELDAMATRYSGIANLHLQAITSDLRLRAATLRAAAEEM